MGNVWDATTLKKLKALLGKGLSTAEIGKRLGISKNAVVGKLNRMGWNAKAGTVSVQTSAPKASVKPSAKTATKKAVAIKPTTKKAESAPKKSAPKATDKKNAVGTTKEENAKVVSRAGKMSQKELAMHQRIIQHSLDMANLKPNQCRWPIGDPDSDDFHFCGKPVFVGKPYCYEHCRQAYQFTPPKKK